MFKRISKIVLPLSFMLALALSLSPAMGDIPPNPQPPKPKPPANVKAAELPLTIKLQNDDKPIRLELPAKALAAGETAEGDAETASNGGNSKTIIAAMFLSLAALAGGLWAVKHRSRSAGAAVATVLILGVLGLWVSESNANVPPLPPRENPVTPAQKGLSITIESTAKGKAAVLHISEKQWKLISEQLKEKE